MRKHLMANPLASIVSAGATRFGAREGMYARELFVEAAQEAFDACPNLSPERDIDGLFIGMMSESYEHQAHIAPAIADWLGLLPVPAYRTEAACASSGVAMRCALHAIQSGMHEVVLVGGVEKMTNLRTSAITEVLGMASDYPFEQWHGI